MSTVRMSDVTLKQETGKALSFKEKVELVRLLDRLKTDVIEIGVIEQEKANSLFIKTAADAVTQSTLAVETGCAKEDIDRTWNALKNAPSARLQINVPVSLVQMEYLYHKKPEAMKQDVMAAVAYAKTLCSEVEFIASDAARSERDFLYDIINSAIEAGADVITIADTAGESMPDEFAAFIKDVKANVPALENVILGAMVTDELTMADACLAQSILSGVREVKASIYPQNTASLKNLAAIMAKKGSTKGFTMNVRSVEMKRLYDQAARMFTETRSKNSPFDSGVREDVSGRVFTKNDDLAAIVNETKRLGYDLSEEDQIRVYVEFMRLAGTKEVITSPEIDVIVASYALQVPPAYALAEYIINASNVFSASAHIRLKKNGEVMESVALGDGPVDASFLAIEQIAGVHYELDDFQIRAVTEGREAMGEALVKLRVGGKIYSGRGLSTDIIGSSISAYINALNKIVYEEENE